MPDIAIEEVYYTEEAETVKESATPKLKQYYSHKMYVLAHVYAFRF